MPIAIVLLTLIEIFKVIATSATLAACGVEDIFATTLFVGVNTGLLFAHIVAEVIRFDININNFAYTLQLTERKQLITHHKDYKQALLIMKVHDLIETYFMVLHPSDKLRQLVDAISVSHRNLFPVVDENGIMKGMVKMDDVRHLIFKQKDYDKITIEELMYMPEH